MSAQDRKRRAQGFTLTELLIVIAVMMIIAALGMPALQNLIHRTRVEGAAREATIFLQRARMEAIKANNRAVVEFEVGEPNAMRAFVDFDQDGTFNPDVTATEARTTDFVIARYILPSRVSFVGPVGSGLDAIEFLPIDTAPALILRPDGSVVDAGSFEIGDARENYLRISISPTARAQLAKWNRDDSDWNTQDEAGLWTWY